MQRYRQKQQRRPFPLLLLLVSVLISVLSLASVVSTHAMPVEARTTEPWYAYQANVGFEFVGHVTPNKFYPNPTVKPDDLIKVPGPVEPPTFRRVIITKFAQSVEVKIPYSYKADRPAKLKAKWRVDGMLTLPGIWQQPYPLLPQKEINVEGQEISGVETFNIPIAQFFADLEVNRTKYSVSAEPFELRITPVFEVYAEGLKEPVSVSNTGTFMITIRSSTVEIDDAKVIPQEQNFTETLIVPITVNILGWQVRVSTVRQVSIGALVFFLLIAVYTVWSRRAKPDNRSLLQKLGPNLIYARTFEMPGDSAVVDVRTARELIQLQAHSERPVIKVDNNYYLHDGATCYRLKLSESEPED